MDSIVQSMQQVFDEADCLYTKSQVERAIAQLAGNITETLAESNPLVISVMNGGLVFAGQLLPLLQFPLQQDYMHASRYGEAVQGGTLHWRVRPESMLTDRTVLIIDDILDQGETLAAIVEDCNKAGAKAVYTAVLVEKLHDRKARPDMHADYCALTVEDRFIFGYGMDYKGYWRNAAGIYAVKGL